MDSSESGENDSWNRERTSMVFLIKIPRSRLRGNELHRQRYYRLLPELSHKMVF